MEKKYFKLFMPILLAFSISACGSSNNEHVPPAGTKDLDIAHKLVTFSEGESEDFLRSSGYCNGHPFNVEWNNANAVISGDNLNLSITTAPEGRSAPYYGGEYRSKDFFGYGDFGVSMKPAKVVGTASTFFLYTGEWDSETLHPSTGADDTRNPGNEEGKHDEIDIEFLGKDTTKVQFNYFTNGQGGNEYMYDLGFDASKEFHNYGFRWEEGRITWFVDEKPVYTATKNIPTHPGRMITNYWSGTWQAANWMGTFDGNSTENAQYKWFSSSVQGTHTNKSEPEPTPGPVTPTGWDDVDPVDIEVKACDDVYTATVSSDKKSLDITYTNVAKETYKNLSVGVPSESTRKLYFEAQNLGEQVVSLRTDANAATTHGPNNIKAVNTSATQDGVSVYTDTSWGGSKFELQPATTAKCEVNYDDDIVDLMFMIDSAIYQDTKETHAGHIVIKNLKFLVYEDGGEGGEGGETSDALTLDFSGNGYTCSAANGVSTIKYDSIDDNTYMNVSASISVPEGTDTLMFDVENKGAENVQFNIDLRNGETSYVIEREGITYDWYNEAEHRAQINVGAGATRQIKLAFDPTAGVNTILMFVNSSWAETTATHTNGHIVITNARFTASN